MMFYDISGFLGARELARKTMTLYELYCKLLGTNVPISENIILGMYIKTINFTKRSERIYITNKHHQSCNGQQFFCLAVPLLKYYQ
jgi:hypothetical protein